MAFYIVIEKMSENEGSAIYRFTGDGGRAGSLQIDKVNGEVSLIESMPGDEKGHMFNRAAIKIMKEWKGGSLPAMTEWAS